MLWRARFLMGTKKKGAKGGSAIRPLRPQTADLPAAARPILRWAVLGVYRACWLGGLSVAAQPAGEVRHIDFPVPVPACCRGIREAKMRKSALHRCSGGIPQLLRVTDGWQILFCSVFLCVSFCVIEKRACSFIAAEIRPFWE